MSAAGRQGTRGEGLRRARLIAAREFRERVLQRAYRIALVVGALAAAGAVVLPTLIGGDDGASSEEIVVAVAGPADAAVRIQALRDAAPLVRGAPIRLVRASGAAAVRKAVRDGDQSVGLIVGGTAKAPQVAVVAREDGGGALADRAATLIDTATTAAQLEGTDAVSDLVPADLRPEVVSGSGPTGQSAAVVSVLGLLLYIAGILLTQMYATGVVSDRTNRVTERLLTAAQPVEHLAGKLVGVGAAGLLQFAVWIVAGLAANAAAGSGAALDGVPVGLLAFFPVALVLTYVLYAAAATILVLPVRKTEDVGGAVTPAVMLQVVAFVFTTAIVAPGSTVSGTIEVLSMVPFFSPLLMLGRLAGGGVPAWEVAVAVAGPLLLAAVFLRAAAPAYARYAIDAPGGKGLKAALATLRR